MSDTPAPDVLALAREVLRLDGEATPEPWEAEPHDGDPTYLDGFGILTIDKSHEILDRWADARCAATYRSAAPALARALLAATPDAGGGVGYRAGLPSVEDVRAHEGRGSLWMMQRNSGCSAPYPFTVHLRTEGDRRVTGLHGFISHELLPWRPDDLFRPCSPDGDPMPWPATPAAREIP